MKLDDLQVEIRPRTTGQVVSLTARLLHHRPGPLLAAWGFYTLGSFGLAVFFLQVLKLHLAWVCLFTLLGAPLFSSPLIVTIGHLVFSSEISLAQVLRATGRRILPFMLLFVLHRLLISAGVLCLVIPGFYLWKGGWFLGPIVLLEGSSMKTSWRRGRRFASGLNAHVAVHALSAAAVLIYLTLAMGSLLHFLNVKVFGLTFAALTRLVFYPEYYYILGLLSFSLVVPLVTIVWFFVYLDVRTRKEGWDLELAFRARAAQLEQGLG